MIRINNNERILITSENFRTGRQRDLVDYCITDNDAIGRYHATIVKKNGMYYVIDENSTNHTYVNGKMIPVEAETPIKQGDIIRLANEDFEFRIQK